MTNNPVVPELAVLDNVQRELRVERLKVRGLEMEIKRLKELITTAHKLTRLMVAHNHTDGEMDGELNLLSYFLETDVIGYNDDEIPF